MSEFVNLEEDQDSIIISNIPTSSEVTETKSSTEITSDSLDIIALDPIELDTSTPNEEESICVKEQCESRYKCTDNTEYFKVTNLFSELTDDFQRETIKKNLGIGSAYSLIWGNIAGNLVNQKDLYNFVLEEINKDINVAITDFNAKLNTFSTNFIDRLNSKANLYSPAFTGTPTTSLPEISDNSTRVASTEWVRALLKGVSSDSILEGLSISPTYILYGDSPTNVIITWSYSKDITVQAINDISLDKDVRTYTLSNISTSTLIKLTYTYNGTEYYKYITFDVKYPYYYGVSSDYTKLSKTLSKRLEVTSNTGEYIYVLVPETDNLRLSVNGIIGGFNLVGTQSIFNNIYSIYKSENSNLGTVNIDLV